MSENIFAPFMREALALAENGRWSACPNPTVGAVLVRDGQVVARGWHHAAGQPHAEVECLRDAQRQGIDPAQCTLVVTLEPCNHYGKTPPCSEAACTTPPPRRPAVPTACVPPVWKSSARSASGNAATRWPTSWPGSRAAPM